MKKLSEMQIRQGGLMRCCTLSLQELADTQLEIGDSIACKYCNCSMVVAKDGVIEWDCDKNFD